MEESPLTLCPITLWLSPHGHLHLALHEDAPTLDPALQDRLQESFSVGTGYGLLMLGARETGHALPAVLAYWRDFGGLFITALCTRAGEGEALPDLPAPTPDELQAIAFSAPPMPGSEYLSTELLQTFWTEMGTALKAVLRKAKAPVQAFLKSLNPAWNLVGRVHFNLAENRRDEQYPFAFLATYTSQLSAHGKAQHLPLGQALREYAGAADKDRLLSLLLPVQRASENLSWLKRMVDAGEIFHPLKWTPQDAFRFLGSVREMEQAGVVLRMPAVWKTARPTRPKVSAQVGSIPPSGFGKDALLDFRVEVTLDGEVLTEDELKSLLAATHGLALVRGQWVEVDGEKLKRTLAKFKEAERLATVSGLPFAEAMRLLAGAGLGAGEGVPEQDAVWAQVQAGSWLAELLRGLRAPETLASIDPGPELCATLRPYQQTGLRWLHLLSGLGLGACLADDMGLGKTIQVLSLLLTRRRKPSQGQAPRQGQAPSLLVAPASLLANWESEIRRFTPGLKARVLHPSFVPGGELKSVPAELQELDLAITSYGTVLRLPWMTDQTWDLAILDEAQAIKNPGTKQTRAVKQLKARARIAMTGTPLENRLGDLWSLFDFINPGLLGSAKAFTAYTKTLETHDGTSAFGPLRNLVRPYILRRLKTDKSVISDLPDKTELQAYCALSKAQVVHYREGVEELARQLESVDGIQRKGVVLAFLMRFKQICNHPSQYLGDNAWKESDSGKFARLREICEVIADKQEKVLIFTQFKETTGPLAAFLARIFGRPGLVLHGETEIKKRKELVKQFQEDETVPFFVLSLKAGGSGLNLTGASHVIHFDRWWNPAVENQATDRAFRIGQTRNVLVHKFICKGTVEEKIDALIESKRQLSQDLLEGGAELNLTAMTDKELLRLVSLDLNAVVEE